MRTFFNPDSAFMTIMNRIGDIILLNILFIITSLPLITIGTSLSSVYAVTLKMVRGEESYIFRSYFKAFRQNFKQSTIIWLLEVTFLLFFYIDCRIFIQMGISEKMAMRVIFPAMCLAILMFTSYIFPLIARFENTLINMIKNALIMLILHFPSTIAVLVITILPVVITFLTAETIYYGILVWLLFGFAAIALANSVFLRKIFDSYSPKDTEENEVLPAEADTSEETDPYIEKSTDQILAEREADHH